MTDDAGAAPPIPAAPKAFYGLVRDQRLSSAHVQVWRPTHDVTDLSLPPEEFVPCLTREEGIEELRARNPCTPDPEDGGVKPYPVVRVAAANASRSPYAQRLHAVDESCVLVTDRPALAEIPSRYRVDAARIVRTAAVHGGVYLEVPGVTGRDGYNASDTLARTKLYHDDLYRASDMVMREVAIVPGRGDKAYCVLPNAEKAAHRRKRAENDRKRREAEEKKEAAAREVRKKQEAETSRYKQAVEAVAEAAKKLWRDVPELTDFFAEPYTYYRNTGAAVLLRRVVAIHERFHGRGKWRTPGYVGAALTAYYAERKHVGSPADPDRRYYLQSETRTARDGKTAEQVEVPIPAAVADRDWLLREAARAHRAARAKTPAAPGPAAKTGGRSKGKKAVPA